MCGTRRLRDNLIDSIIWYSVIELLRRNTNTNILNTRIVILIKRNLFERKEPEMRRVHLNFFRFSAFFSVSLCRHPLFPFSFKKKKRKNAAFNIFPFFSWIISLHSFSFVFRFFLRWDLIEECRGYAAPQQLHTKHEACERTTSSSSRCKNNIFVTYFSIYSERWGLRVEGPPSAYPFYQRSNHSCVNGLAAASHTKSKIQFSAKSPYYSHFNWSHNTKWMSS